MKKLVIALVLLISPAIAMAEEPEYFQLFPIWIPVVDHDANFPKLVVGTIKIIPRPGMFNVLCENAARLQDTFIIHFNKNPVYQNQVMTRRRAALGFSLLPVANSVLPDRAAFLLEIEFNNLDRPDERILEAMTECFAYNPMRNLGAR
ncbi:MAG: hypothetical protein FWF01_03075 [Alphaproteobacteria bacterium]|nr:hypothetical protein [Alphaproteobacteria bacterium]